MPFSGCSHQGLIGRWAFQWPLPHNSMLVILSPLLEHWPVRLSIRRRLFWCFCLSGGILRRGRGSVTLAVEWLLQISPGFLLRSGRIVVRVLRQAVFVDGALALPEQVVDFASVDVTPDADPLRVEVSSESRAERVGRCLIVLLIEHGLAHAEIRQRIVGS